ncbi:uncharacterized protein LOC110232753 [Exaiptasia diaphana]|uniref:Uncharacterized protein n=1 Tax=Exaiptasia diaphana TaxID=2652724 RepID=A0A913WSX8_EXADI|nr:uncharacterized protein LOC110232753 [Exaiptasia diaphana]
MVGHLPSSFFLVAFGFFLLVVINSITYTTAQSLQKPHFQVEHKAGVLDIMATKDKATVDVKSDTIRLVVKPGDRQIPVGKAPDTKVVNVQMNCQPPFQVC